MKNNEAEKHRTKLPKINQNFNLWLHFGASCLIVCRGGAFVFATCFSEPMAGYLLGPILASPAAPLVRFS